MTPHLLVLFALLAVTALATSTPRGPGLPPGTVPLESLASQADGWEGMDGAPEDALPIDPRAVDTLRRTYVKQGRAVWVAVARYYPLGRQESRPSVGLVATARGLNRLEQRTLQLDAHGTVLPLATMAVPGPAAPQRVLSIMYWYQLGDVVTPGEYRIRLAVFLDNLLGQHRALLLFRLAALDPQALQDFLRTFYPHLSTLASPRARTVLMAPDTDVPPDRRGAGPGPVSRAHAVALSRPGMGPPARRA
jgi:EpsI family protein